MWPVLFELQTASGPQAVFTYGALVLLAVLATPACVVAFAGAVGVSRGHLVGAWASAVTASWAGSLAGAILGVGGLSWPAAALGALLFLRVWPIAWRALPDLFAPAVASSLAIVKVGCLLAGCCAGAPAPTPHHPLGLLPPTFPGGQVWLSTTFPFLTTEFHQGMGVHDVPLYPTQLWTAAAWAALAAALTWRLPRRRWHGEVAAAGLLVGGPLGWVAAWAGAAAPQWGGAPLWGMAVALAAGAGIAALGRRRPGVEVPGAEASADGVPDLD